MMLLLNFLSAMMIAAICFQGPVVRQGLYPGVQFIGDELFSVSQVEEAIWWRWSLSPMVRDSCDWFLDWTDQENNERGINNFSLQDFVSFRLVFMGFFKAWESDGIWTVKNR